MRPLNVLGVKVVELEQLREEIRNLFETLSEAHNASLLGAGYWSPLVDLCDAQDCVTARVELPGVRADQVKVTFVAGVLKISGEKRRHEPLRKPACYHCLERGYGTFSRALRLPWPIDVTKATARLTDGVLLIKLPKVQERRQSEVRIAVTES